VRWYKFKLSKKYVINKLGQVKNLRSQRVTSPRPDKDGYLRLVLWFNKRYNNLAVHRLIALHFIDNPKKKTQVNHIDGNKANNSVSNLEWVTPEENRKHSTYLKLQAPRRGVKHHNNKLSVKDIREIRRLCRDNCPHDMISSIYNIKPGTVSKIHLRTRWAHVK